jgi:hypothetical protein
MFFCFLFLFLEKICTIISTAKHHPGNSEKRTKRISNSITTARMVSQKVRSNLDFMEAFMISASAGAASASCCSMRETAR